MPHDGGGDGAWFGWRTVFVKVESEAGVHVRGDETE